MFSFVTLGTNNIAKSKLFYEELLEIISIVKVEETERYVGYAKKNNLKNSEFYLMKPHNKKKATCGNGTMITFTAESRKNVIDFYNLALKLGGKDEGLPGPRHEENFYAYFRDLDGNKICVFCLD
ncbi:VOC family protein [Pelagibacteraceae bacterium]|nr:VOC family protein [Pelagibacteraceae bacterium]